MGKMLKFTGVAAAVWLVVKFVGNARKNATAYDNGITATSFQASDKL